MIKVKNPIHTTIFSIIFIVNVYFIINHFYQSEINFNIDKYEKMVVWVYVGIAFFCGLPVYSVATENHQYNETKNPFIGKSRVREFIHSPKFIRCFIFALLYFFPVFFNTFFKELLSLTHNND